MQNVTRPDFTFYPDFVILKGAKRSEESNRNQMPQINLAFTKAD
jgi:hypothetical protein